MQKINLIINRESEPLRVGSGVKKPPKAESEGKLGKLGNESVDL